jgi:hypothetical protein
MAAVWGGTDERGDESSCRNGYGSGGCGEFGSGGGGSGVGVVT